jgi:hypothetical protein
VKAKETSFLALEVFDMIYTRNVGKKTNGRAKKDYYYVNLPEAIVTGKKVVLTVLEDGSVLMQFK